ncbi:MAG: glycosyl hydrolase, partial [Chloroflexota bacterium]
MNRFLFKLFFVTILGAIGLLPLKASSAIAIHNNPTKEDVLAWLTNQKNSCSVLSGQHIGHGYGTTAGYDDLVVELAEQSGHYVGLVEADYHDWDYIQDAYAFNQPLIKHWNRGGLVGINWSSPNPWTGGDVWDQSQADLNELLDPNSAAHAVWMSQLDYVADGLAHLEENGVVVLFRPLHEMNGDWFWWGAHIHVGENDPYIQLWRHMHYYFTETKGLDNLLWVYAASTYTGESWKQPVDFYYPGDDVVDIVALDVYDDAIDAAGYEQMLELGKPFALAEVGPLNQRDGSFDNLFMLEQILNNYPESIYFLTWHGWIEDDAYQHLPMAHNQNAVSLMQHECVTTVDGIIIEASSSELQSGHLLLKELSSRPKFDGQVDSTWSAVQYQRVSQVLSGNLPSSTDLRAQFKAGYQDDILYMLIDVNDDEIINDSGINWWEDDGIELYIDGDRSGGSTFDNSNDFLIGFRVNDPVAYAGGYSAPLPSGTFAWQITEMGYVLELAIPLADLGITGPFGFDVHINEDDDGNGRDQKLAWYAEEDVSWERPEAFGLAYVLRQNVILP